MEEVLSMGCWTPRESVGVGGTWSARLLADDGSRFRVLYRGDPAGEVTWGQTGRHNVANALAVLAAARHAGVPLDQGIAALRRFQGVKRRMELRGEIGGVAVYDDFAHHPTAIATTLEGLCRRGGDRRILAVLEPRSNTMRLGVHNSRLAESLSAAERIYVFVPEDLGWDAAPVFAPLGPRAEVFSRVEDIVVRVADDCRAGDQVLVMSNGGFQGIHQRLLDALRNSASRRPVDETAPGGLAGEEAAVPCGQVQVTSQ
jgi:UDP-N-acetylmuramate: L-alanyl-gamma-D-glutamyl-meso-diaminopimelate ligase